MSPHYKLKANEKLIKRFKKSVVIEQCGNGIWVIPTKGIPSQDFNKKIALLHAQLLDCGASPKLIFNFYNSIVEMCEEPVRSITKMRGKL